MKSGRINKIIHIAIDTLRRDHLGCYGYPYDTTPFIDNFSKKCLVYDNAWAVSNKTDPAFTTMETGLLPEEHGIIHHGGNITDEEENKVWRTSCVAEDLQRQGWETVGLDFLGRWHRRGFDYYAGLTKDRSDKEHIIETWRKKLNIQPGTFIQNILEKTPLYRLMLNQLFKRQNPPYMRADKLVDEAIRLLRPGADQYLFLHFWDPHIPYWPPKEFIRNDVKDNRTLKSIRHTIKAPLRRYFFDSMMYDKKTIGDAINAYDGEIRFCDYHIGRLLTKLNMDNTLIILNADHGESLTENEIYFTHDGSADCVMKIPMMIYHPKIDPVRSNDKVDLTLIAKTIRRYGLC